MFGSISALVCKFRDRDEVETDHQDSLFLKDTVGLKFYERLKFQAIGFTLFAYTVKSPPRKLTLSPAPMNHIVRLKTPLLFISIIGFLTINLPFLYYALIARDVYAEALNNKMALLFMAEAFALMFFFAFMIHKMKLEKPGWVFFIAMSILGSLAFSIPFQLYLMARRSEVE